MKVAVTTWRASIVRTQVSSAEQAPLQPVKVEPCTAGACEGDHGAVVDSGRAGRHRRMPTGRVALSPPPWRSLTCYRAVGGSVVKVARDQPGRRPSTTTQMRSRGAAPAGEGRTGWRRDVGMLCHSRVVAAELAPQESLGARIVHRGVAGRLPCRSRCSVSGEVAVRTGDRPSSALPVTTIPARREVEPSRP